MSERDELIARLRAQGRIVAELDGPKLIGPEGIIPMYTVRWFEAEPGTQFHVMHQRTFWSQHRALEFLDTIVHIIPLLEAPGPVPSVQSEVPYP